jgi:hypothetical protein
MVKKDIAIVEKDRLIEKLEAYAKDKEDDFWNQDEDQEFERASSGGG